MAAILDAILNIIAFPMWDFGGLLVCYLWYQILPKSVEKPFVAICWGLNCRLTRLMFPFEYVLSYTCWDKEQFDIIKSTQPIIINW